MRAHRRDEAASKPAPEREPLHDGNVTSSPDSGIKYKVGQDDVAYS